MLIVHHLGVSQSDRIVWLCEELEIAYELRRYSRDPQSGLAPAEYRALTPFGTAPVITDGDLTLGESGAIIEYIIMTYGGGRLAIPPGEPAYVDYLFWWHFANGSVMPAAMAEMIAQQVDPQGAVPLLNVLRQRLDRAYSQIEDRLGTAPYLAGEAFTAADIINAFALTGMRFFSPRDLAPYPNIQAYLARLAARPAFQRARSIADPDLQAPPG